MRVALDLPAEALRRLQAEAMRRGVSIDDVITEFASRLPDAVRSSGRRFSFVGIGASGDTRPIDIRRERFELAGGAAPADG